MKRRDEVNLAFYRLRLKRWENYRIHSDGWIYPAGIGHDWYSPSQEDGLPSELARVNQAWKLRRLGYIDGPRRGHRHEECFGFSKAIWIPRADVSPGGASEGGTRRYAQFADGDLFACGACPRGERRVVSVPRRFPPEWALERLAQLLRYLEETRPQLFPGLPLESQP